MEELMNQIEENLDSIFVREQLNGKWGSYSLAELPAPLGIKHAFRFLRENRAPVMVNLDYASMKKCLVPEEPESPPCPTCGAESKHWN